MKDTQHYLSSHPFIALFIGLSYTSLGYFVQHWQIPTLFMQLFQIGAWSGTIILALIALHGFWKKRKK